MTFVSVVPLVPVLVTLVIGLVLLIGRRDRLSRRGRAFGIAGCVVLGVGAVGNAVYAAVLPTLVSSLDVSITGIGVISLVYGVLSALVDAAGIALLIAAVLHGTGRTAAPAAPPGYAPAPPPFPPPGYPPQQGYPPGGPHPGPQQR